MRLHSDNVAKVGIVSQSVTSIFHEDVNCVVTGGLQASKVNAVKCLRARTRENNEA